MPSVRVPQRHLITAMRSGQVKWQEVLSNTVLGRLQTTIGALIVCHLSGPPRSAPPWQADLSGTGQSVAQAMGGATPVIWFTGTSTAREAASRIVLRCERERLLARPPPAAPGRPLRAARPRPVPGRAARAGAVARAPGPASYQGSGARTLFGAVAPPVARRRHPDVRRGAFCAQPFLSCHRL